MQSQASAASAPMMEGSAACSLPPPSNAGADAWALWLTSTRAQAPREYQAGQCVLEMLIKFKSCHIGSTKNPRNPPSSDG